MPWARRKFLQAYQDNRKKLHTVAVEGYDIVIAIHHLLRSGGSQWIGTASELLTELARQLHGVDPGAPYRKGWPQNAKALSNQLRRVSPHLSAEGVEITFWRETKTRNRNRIVQLKKTGDDAQETATHAELLEALGIAVENTGDADARENDGRSREEVRPHVSPRKTKGPDVTDVTDAELPTLYHRFSDPEGIKLDV